MKAKNQYFANAFSDLLRKWCKTHGSKQEDFAKVVGVHANMITRYKKGEAYPTDEVIERIAQILNVDKSVFFPDKRRTRHVVIKEIRHSIQDFTTDELLAELKRRIEAP